MKQIAVSLSVLVLSCLTAKAAPENRPLAQGVPTAQTPAPANPAPLPPANPAPAASVRYTLDSAASSIQFYVSARLTNVKGVFRSIQANAAGSGSVESLRGQVVIDTASVFTREKKRDDHLRADDFFWSDKFPQAYATVKAIGPPAGGVYPVTIALRIRDKEKDFTVPVRIEETAAGLNAAGQFTVDRTFYDLTGEYLANKVMDDEVQVSFQLVLIKAR